MENTSRKTRICLMGHTTCLGNLERCYGLFEGSRASSQSHLYHSWVGSLGQDFHLLLASDLAVTPGHPAACLTGKVMQSRTAQGTKDAECLGSWTTASISLS